MTPGHAGKVCEYNDWLVRRLGGLRWDAVLHKWQYCAGGGGDPEVRFCPACGIRLTPDEDALPIPEGCERIEEGIYAYEDMYHYIGAISSDKRRLAFKVIAPTKVQDRALWKRCFGK